MTGNFIICTFYTPGYSKYLDKWVSHLEKTGCEYTARELPDKGKWSLNDCMKPQFILDMMHEYPHRNIAWVDIDGTIIKPPTLFDEITTDLAGYLDPVVPSTRKFIDDKYTYTPVWGGKLVWGGTLWFANNERTRKFVQLWIDSCNLDPHRYVGDQDNLNEMLDKHADKMGLTFTPLPATYAFYVPYGRHEWYGKLDEAVILQEFTTKPDRDSK